MPVTGLDLLTPFLTGVVSLDSAMLGKHVIKDVFLEINGYPVEYAHGISVNITADNIDATRFGATYKENVRGCLNLEMKTSVFAGDLGLDGLLWSSMSTKTPIRVEIRPFNNDKISTQNPSWSADFVILTYTPFDGSIGEAATVDIGLGLNGGVTLS